MILTGTPFQLPHTHTHRYYSLNWDDAHTCLSCSGSSCYLPSIHDRYPVMHVILIGLLIECESRCWFRVSIESIDQHSTADAFSTHDLNVWSFKLCLLLQFCAKVMQMYFTKICNFSNFQWQWIFDEKSWYFVTSIVSTRQISKR